MTTPAGSQLIVANGYLKLPVTVDPDALLADELDTLAALFPGWTSHEGNLEVAVLEAVARLVGQLAQVAALVPPSIFAYIGQLGGVPPLVGSPATCSSTWTMVDSAGYTVPAGTVVAFGQPDGSLIEFTTVAGFTVPAGQQSAAGIVLTDVLSASGDNGLPAQTLVQVDSLAFILSVASSTVTTGGVDAEDQATYLDRLSQEMQLLAPRPITTSDFAAYARNTVGVYRALAIDGLVPSPRATGQERAVALCPVDAAGQPVSGAVSSALVAALEAKREVNFLVSAITPTYTSVNVSWQAARIAGADANALTIAVNAAIAGFLAPGTWAQPPGSLPAWTPGVTTVRYLDLVSVIHRVPGVDHVVSLTLGTGGTLAASDLALAGDAPLPTAGTVSGMVV